jgi:xylan alpha-glucuronosyltransferase
MGLPKKTIKTTTTKLKLLPRLPLRMFRCRPFNIMIILALLLFLAIALVRRDKEDNRAPPPLHRSSRNSFAFVTVLTSPSYIIGAQVLAYSLRATGSLQRASLICLATEALSKVDAARLESAGFQVQRIDSLANPIQQKESLLAERFADTYTKLRAWQLVEFDRVVLLDADVLALHNVDALFDFIGDDEHDDVIAAAVDCCDRFNSGVVVLRPSEQVFDAMVEALPRVVSYDGGDQGFLNVFFGADSKWKRLPYRFNAVQTTYESRAWHWRDVALLHYMQFKPWLMLPDEQRHLAELHDLWSDAHIRMLESNDT